MICERHSGQSFCFTDVVEVSKGRCFCRECSAAARVVSGGRGARRQQQWRWRRSWYQRGGQRRRWGRACSSWDLSQAEGLRQALEVLMPGAWWVLEVQGVSQAVQQFVNRGCKWESRIGCKGRWAMRPWVSFCFWLSSAIWRPRRGRLSRWCAVRCPHTNLSALECHVAPKAHGPRCTHVVGQAESRAEGDAGSRPSRGTAPAASHWLVVLRTAAFREHCCKVKTAGLCGGFYIAGSG